MSSLARAEIESLLRARRLDRTLTSVLPEEPVRDQAALLAGATAAEREALVRIVAPTGIVVLDAQLGGGFPRGHLSEIVGPLSSS